MATNALRTLGQLASVAGNVVAGANADRQNRLAQALAAKKQADEEERNRVLNLVGAATARKTGIEADNLLDPAAKITITPNGAVILPSGHQLVQNPDGTFNVQRTAPAPAVAAPTPLKTPAEAIPDDLAPTSATSALQGLPAVPKPTVTDVQGPTTPRQPAVTAPATRVPSFAKPPDAGKSPAEIPGTPEWREAERFKAGLTKPKFDNYVDAEGGVHLTTPEKAAEAGWTKQTAGAGGGVRGFGQGGPFGGASALGSVKEMDTVRPRMEQFELSLLAAQPDDPGVKLFDVYRRNILDAANHASGNHGAIASAVSNATRTFAADEQVRQNPALARYVRDVSRWIVSDLNLSRNASDERGRMDVLASSVLGDPISNMEFGQRRQYIQDVIGTRRARMEGLRRAVPAMETMLDNVARQSGRPRAATSSAPVGPSSSSGTFDLDAYINQFPVKKP